MAQAFDPSRGQLKGDAPIRSQNAFRENFTGGLFDVSENGILIYATGSGGAKQLTWFDRTGKNLGVTGEVADYYDLRISPDGQKLAVQCRLSRRSYEQRNLGGRIGACRAHATYD